MPELKMRSVYFVFFDKLFLDMDDLDILVEDADGIYNKFGSVWIGTNEIISFLCINYEFKYLADDFWQKKNLA